MTNIKIIESHSAEDLEHKVNGWIKNEYDPLLPDRIGKMTFHILFDHNNEVFYVCFIEIYGDDL